MSEEKKSYSVLIVLEGENLQKFKKVREHTGIKPGNHLFIHLLTQYYNTLEMDVTTFMKQFCEDCVSKDTCNPKDASVCMYQQKGSE